MKNDNELCSMHIVEEVCPLKPCQGCGFSLAEIERRKALPLVKLDNGLYGKRVGKRIRPEA